MVEFCLIVKQTEDLFQPTEYSEKLHCNVNNPRLIPKSSQSTEVLTTKSFITNPSAANFTSFKER